VNFAGPHREIDPTQNGTVFNDRVEVFDVKYDWGFFHCRIPFCTLPCVLRPGCQKWRA
jgi:hypothetical protein